MADDQLFQRFGKEFAPGTVLFREGEPGNEMYVVQQGRVTVSKRVGDVEKILASLGLRSLDEAVGRVDLLELLRHEPGSRGRLVDLAALLAPPTEDGARPVKNVQARNDRPGDRPLDDRMIQDAAAALEWREPVQLEYPIRNDNRTVGARLSGEIARR